MGFHYIFNTPRKFFDNSRLTESSQEYVATILVFLHRTKSHIQTWANVRGHFGKKQVVNECKATVSRHF